MKQGLKQEIFHQLKTGALIMLLHI